METDNAPKLDLITRRGLLTATVGGLVVACRGQSPAIVTSKNRVETPGCKLASEQEEGPYYVDQRLVRQDITENGRASRFASGFWFSTENGARPSRTQLWIYGTAMPLVSTPVTLRAVRADRPLVSADRVPWTESLRRDRSLERILAPVMALRVSTTARAIILGIFGECR